MTKTINLYHSMKRYLKFGIFSLVVFASVFFSRKAERSNVQNVILLNNVEALAAGEILQLDVLALVLWIVL